MLMPWLLALLGFAYAGLLFLVAHAGDRLAAQGRYPISRPVVYSLSLAVYCTSWAFYGTVGQSAEVGWWLPPTYVGTILLFLLGSPFLDKIIRLSRRQNITSIADFIAARYGRDPRVAVFVTVIAVFGLIPYIALQLKAVDVGFNAVAGVTLASDSPQDFFADTALYVAVALAAFAILFGTRHVDATEHHPGMMLALAFEALVKLFAFVAVGAFITFGLFDGPLALAARIAADPAVSELRAAQRPLGHFLALTVLGFFAIFCLPWQTHVAVVENSGPADLRRARWLFPAYLIAIGIFVLPIANAGLLTFGAAAPNTDLFTLSLPLAAHQPGLVLLTFIGGLSAATGMVIVASVALSTMICNEIVMPALLHVFPGLRHQQDLTSMLLRVRRTAILLLLAAAYAYYRLIARSGALAAIGEIAMSAAALFGPPVLAGAYWKRASRNGALIGLAAGFAVWIYTLLLPQLAAADFLPRSLIATGPGGIEWLKPTELFGFSGFDPLANGLFWSLFATTAGLVLGSLASQRSLVERIQAAVFVDASDRTGAEQYREHTGALTLKELHALAEPFVGRDRADTHFAQFSGTVASTGPASSEHLESVQRLLGSTIGASSARRVIDAAISGKALGFEDVVSIVDGASQAIRFSRELLHATLENVSQGISVVDADLKLVAWNRRYVELLRLPPDFVGIGKPVEDVLRYNATRGEMGPGDAGELVSRRIAHLKRRTAYVYQRVRLDGTVLEIRGNPMPAGGFVTTYADVTEYKHTEQALKESNETLERRVQERTGALSAMNVELSAAKAQAENANQSKTRFLAAASHDVLQPLNAAGLFAAALTPKVSGFEQKALVNDIEQCLRTAEGMLTDLLDISKLDAGAVRTAPADFALQELLSALDAEFQLQARERGLRLQVKRTTALARSDAKLLRRILQNFVANAVRYTVRGRVVIGCRRSGAALRIEVWDTGMGIPVEQRGRIFEEFYRAQPADAAGAPAGKGFGLGLAIADRIARRLDHRITVRSWPGRGSVFAVEVPRSPATAVLVHRPYKALAVGSLRGVRALIVDNDASVMRGMAALLTSWQCEVRVASGRNDLPNVGEWTPDVLIVDYHLDRGETGVALAEELRTLTRAHLPLVVVTADAAEAVCEEVEAADGVYLRKPVKPLALRSVLRRVVLHDAQRSNESGSAS